MLDDWRPHRASCSLQAGELHVWRVFLDDFEGAVPRLIETLSELERTRAARFRSSLRAERWVVARAWLRRLLGAYLDDAPERVTLVHPPGSKPNIQRNGTRLRFNASDSDGIALYGFTVDDEVGVDVERHRRDLDLVGIARIALGEDAVSFLRGTPPADRPACFARLWARNEAAMKCRGIGLGRAVESEGFRADPTGRSLSYIADVDVSQDFAGAVASSRKPGAVRLWDTAATDGAMR